MSIISEKIFGETIYNKIQSTNLKSAEYNTGKKELTITFQNDHVYLYESVDWKTFTKFRMSDSQGKFFATNISKNFSHKKIK